MKSSKTENCWLKIPSLPFLFVYQHDKIFNFPIQWWSLWVCSVIFAAVDVISWLQVFSLLHLCQVIGFHLPWCLLQRTSQSALLLTTLNSCVAGQEWRWTSLCEIKFSKALSENWIVRFLCRAGTFFWQLINSESLSNSHQFVLRSCCPKG